MNKFNRNEGRARFDELYGLATAYVDQLQALSARDPERVGRYLKKPNVHSLIELYVHTIPAFGHVRRVQELLFETAHQPLKRAICRSNMRDPQVTAVEATLSNNWETRLSLEMQSLGDPDTWTDVQCLRVQRLVAGSNAKELPGMDQVRSVFCSPVLSALSQVGKRLSSRAGNGVTWSAEVEDPSRLNDLESWIRLSAQYTSVFEETLDCIRRSPSRRSFKTASVRLIKHASSWNTGWSVRDGTPELHRRNVIIRPSSVVQALTRSNGGILEVTSEICELCKFAENAQSQAGSFSVTSWYVLVVFEAESTSSCFLWRLQS
jgi:hypothetical protein